jgi:hypothetical protein
MARPLKPRPLDDSARNVLDRLSKVAHDPLPHNPEILRLLIQALLQRISRRSPKEALFLEGYIRSIASVEREFMLSPEERTRLIELVGPEKAGNGDDLMRSFLETMLPDICAAPTPKGPHDPETLTFQQAWLTAFLQSHPVSVRHRLDEFHSWLQQHDKTIQEYLAHLPCFCEYQESLGGLTKDDLTDCTGPAQLIDIILATLHGSTRAAVRKILSHQNR